MSLLADARVPLLLSPAPVESRRLPLLRRLGLAGDAGHRPPRDETPSAAPAIERLAAAHLRDGRGARAPAATIFHEPWWLSAASDGAYEETVVESGGAVVGRLPYLRLRRFGGQIALVMPTMTHVLGPSLAADLPGGGRHASLRRFTICRDLLSQLPRAGHVWFALHRRVTDTLAFEAAGFNTGVRFTAEIAPESPEQLWRQMRDKTRNVIRRAQESLTVGTLDDPATFLDFYEENLRKRARSNNYDRRICGNLMAACLERGRGRIRVASNAAGRLQAAIFTGGDDEAEYYLMSTRAPDSGNGATSLLIWDALQATAASGRVFDMDGIDIQTNLMLITGFGGVLKPRYVASITSPAFHVTRAVKTGFNAGLARCRGGLRRPDRGGGAAAGASAAPA